jgi:hypothetical protein
MEEDLDFEYEILPQIKEDEKIKDLENGLYHIYFNGVANFGTDYCYEYACYEGWSEWIADDIFYEKLDELPGIKDIDEKDGL